MIIRTCICIPIYNNPETITKVVADCLTQTAFPVLVVDDGSEIPVEGLLGDSLALAALASGRLNVLRFPANRGKGLALQEAFKHCVGLGFTHLFAVDGDGQHLVSEIPKLVEAARENPWDLIIGNRKLAGENVPGASKFGRKFSNFWVGFETGKAIKDSQSGFRIYPLFRVQNLRFWTRRYDFEIEVLIRLLWRGVTVREVEIDVYYPPADERVSHFNKLWDNVRISCLNTVLVTVSLMKSYRSPAGTAIALGVGIFVGCTPFFGLHTLIIAAIAVVFRMNALLLLLGTQISIPPLAPFLALASIRIGHWLAGGSYAPIHSLAGAASHYWHWVLGSFVLGSGLGSIGAGLGYIAATLLGEKPGVKNGPKAAENWNGKTRGGVFGNGILKFVARHLGLNAVYFCLYFIIPYFYLFAPKARRAANEYWSVLRPELGFLARQWLVLHQLFQFGRVLLDRIFQGFSERPRFQTNSKGMDNILGALREGHGLLLLGAHMGGWDLAASLMPTSGFTGEVHLLQYEAEGLTLNKVAEHRGRGHVKALASRGPGLTQPILRIRELLQAAKPIAIMGDRPVANHYELVLFCGRLAPFDVTPFRIAAACGSPVLFTFGFKAAGSVYDFHATKAQHYIYTPGEDKALRCREWVQGFATVLESFVTRYPDQWSNFFPFWSALPTPPEGVEPAKARNSLIEELCKPPSAKPAMEPAPRASAAP